MLIVALMPTYRRRRCAANALACFLAQTHADKRLVIGDDSGELSNQKDVLWEVMAMSPQPSLPAKYNVMARHAFEQLHADAVAVMEDDDVYLPEYLRFHARALAKGRAWSHCAWAWTDGSGGGPAGALRREDTRHAKLHGCLAMSREAFYHIGGWPETKRMDFDLCLLSQLRCLCMPSDPCAYGPSQYVFRWVSTGTVHGQACSHGPDDEGWMERAQQHLARELGPVVPVPPLVPAFDAETEGILTSFLDD